MNSGPLSHLIFFGLPFSHITYSNGFITRWARNDIDTSCATATLSLSSITLRTLNFLPHSRTSLTKSIDHVVFGSIGCSRGFFIFAGEVAQARTRQLSDEMIVTKEIVAGLLLAAGGRGISGSGGGDSNSDLTNWDGTKKRSGWGR